MNLILNEIKSNLHIAFDQQEFKRGDVWLCDLNGASGSEMTGKHPCLIVSNDIGNKFSPVVTVLVITSKTEKMERKKLPVHVYLSAQEFKLERDSVVLGEQMRTLDKWKLLQKLTKVNNDKMLEVEKAMAINLGFSEFIK